MKATDADRGKYGEIFYRLVSVTNHGEPLFRYNRDNGYIVAIAPLPAGEQFQILLEATDGGGRYRVVQQKVVSKLATVHIILKLPQ